MEEKEREEEDEMEEEEEAAGRRRRSGTKSGVFSVIQGGVVGGQTTQKETY